jgi:hypothetical protein
MRHVSAMMARIHVDLVPRGRRARDIALTLRYINGMCICDRAGLANPVSLVEDDNPRTPVVPVVFVLAPFPFFPARHRSHVLYGFLRRQSPALTDYCVDVLYCTYSTRKNVPGRLSTKRFLGSGNEWARIVNSVYIWT